MNSMTDEKDIKAQADFLSLLEFAPDAMIAVDDKGKIVLTNGHAEKLFGYTRMEMVGMSMEDLIPERFRKVHVRHREGYSESPHVRPMGADLDLYAIKKNGTEFPVEVSLGPMKTPQGMMVMAAIRDVTEQKAAREIAERRKLEEAILQTSEEEKQRIGQDLHDDLGQNLLGVALMAKLLEERLRQKGLGDAGAAADIARRMNEAIQKARDLSRGLVPVTVQRGGLVAALEELMGGLEGHFEVVCRLEGLAGGESLNDETSLQLFRIAQEAVKNAVRHGHPQRISLEVQRKGQEVEMLIVDDGVGIEGNKGSSDGLGLRIMQYRAGRIGGSIDVRKRPEGGTSVTCRCPWREKKEKSQ